MITAEQKQAIAKKRQILKQISGYVSQALEQRLPPFAASLLKARNQLSELVVAAKAIETRDPSVGDGLPSDFVGGLDNVILAMRCFRSGYASNDASQQIDNINAIPGFAPVNTVKSEENGKRISIGEFTAYAAGVLSGLAKQDRPAQLASLRALESILNKAGEEDFADVLIPTENDPMKHQADVEDGTLTPGGTSAPSTASTNFAVNPDAVTAPPPSKDPNPATGTVQAGMTGSANPGGAPVNFATTSVPAAANVGPQAPTGDVATSAAGAGESGTAPTNFAATDVAATGTQALVASTTKAATAPVVKSLEEAGREATTKEAAELDRLWAFDLNSPEFMSGRIDPARDFGNDRSK